jgi:hypothetical protein
VQTGIFPGHHRASEARLCVLNDLVPSGAGKPCHQWRTQHGWSETIAVRPRWNTQLGGPFQARNSCWRPGPKGSATRRCPRSAGCWSPWCGPHPSSPASSWPGHDGVAATRLAPDAHTTNDANNKCGWSTKRGLRHSGLITLSLVAALWAGSASTLLLAADAPFPDATVPRVLEQQPSDVAESGHGQPASRPSERPAGLGARRGRRPVR